MNTNLVVIPSRGRPRQVKRAFDQLKQVSEISDFLMIVNEDQEKFYRFDNYQSFLYDRVMRETAPNEHGANGKLNHVIAKYWDRYETITGIDDDCMVTTQGWDRTLSAPIKARGYGLSYGNDGFMREELPTKVMISTNISKALGWFAPPVLFHLYADNFWKKLGQGLNALDYFGDVQLEHWHYLNGKAEIDETYKSIYEPNAQARDATAWQKYQAESFEVDLERVKDALNI